VTTITKFRNGHLLLHVSKIYVKNTHVNHAQTANFNLSFPIDENLPKLLKRGSIRDWFEARSRDVGGHAG